MDDTTMITYGGDFAQPVETGAVQPSKGSGEGDTRYIGGEVSQWVPQVVTSEPDPAGAGAEA